MKQNQLGINHTLLCIGFILCMMGGFSLIPPSAMPVEGDKFPFSYLGTSSQSTSKKTGSRVTTRTKYYAVYEGEAYGETRSYTYHDSFASSADAGRFARSYPALTLTSYIYEEYGQEKVFFIPSDSTVEEGLLSQSGAIFGIYLLGVGVALLLAGVYFVFSDKKRGKTTKFTPMILVSTLLVGGILAVGGDYYFATRDEGTHLAEDWETLSSPTIEEEISDNLAQHTTQGGTFTFSVPEGFSLGEGDMFQSSDGMVGFQPIVQLGDVATGFSAMSKTYTDVYEVISATNSENLIPFTLGNLSGFYGDLLLRHESIYFTVRILTIPEENLLTEILGASEDEKNSQELVETIFQSLTSNHENKDFLTGQQFISSYDGSQLVLNPDGTYIHYVNAENNESGSESGTYEVFSGEDAFHEMEHYGSTNEEQSQYVKWCQYGYILGAETSIRYGMYEQENDGDFRHFPLDLEREIVSKSTYYLLVCTSTDRESTPYLGFYIPNKEVLEMKNLVDGRVSQWGLM